MDDQQLLLIQIVKVADVKLGKKVTLFNMLPGGYIDRLQGSAAFREAGVILRFAEYVAGRNGLVLYCFLLGCVGGVGYVLDRNGRRFEEFFLGREKKQPVIPVIEIISAADIIILCFMIIPQYIKEIQYYYNIKRGKRL